MFLRHHVIYSIVPEIKFKNRRNFVSKLIMQIIKYDIDYEIYDYI